ncbi:MAG: ferritin [Thermoanaerobaculia bacterium]
MARRVKGGKSGGGGKGLATSRLAEAINQQIGNEMHASLQYVSIAAHFDGEDLPQLAAFFYRQAEEEREHAMKFVHFLIDVDAPVRVPAVGAPKSEFATAAEAVALSLDWERTVTEQIYRLVDIAREDRNYIAQRFLDWFVSEQLEEIRTMSTLLALVERAGEDQLLYVEETLAREKLGQGGGGEAAAAE